MSAWLQCKRSRDRPSHPAHSFVENLFASSADSGRVNCQFMAKEWALNTGKLPPGGLHRNSVVKKDVYCGCKAIN